MPPPAAKNPAMLDRLLITPGKLLRNAGLFIWLVIGIILLRGQMVGNDLMSRDKVYAWIAYAGFGLCYTMLVQTIWQQRAETKRIVLLILLSLSIISFAHFNGTGLSAIFLMVSAGVLPWLFTSRTGFIWMLAQSLLMVPVFAARSGFGMTDAILLCGLYLGCSGFLFMSSVMGREQSRARDQLRLVNSELRATQNLLADTERVAERLRIARELHDLIGHHLTALSLNLEVASHLTEGKAQGHVKQAQTLSKLLLSDVREVVSSLRDKDEVNLGSALRDLVLGVPQPIVHLDVPEDFGLEDAKRAQMVLRLTQELITNCIKHSGANNLWIRVTLEKKELRIQARDDGRGAPRFRGGNGMNGMSERLAQFGGSMDVYTAREKGFEVRVRFPLEDPR
jgi:signal transduction histidine kinase